MRSKTSTFIAPACDHCLVQKPTNPGQPPPTHPSVLFKQMSGDGDSTAASRSLQELKRTNGCASVSYGTKAPGFDLLKRAYAYPKRDVLHPLHRQSLAAACPRLARALATISNHRGRGSLPRPPSLHTQAGCTHRQAAHRQAFTKGGTTPRNTWATPQPAFS